MPYTYEPDIISSTLYPVTYRSTQASADSLLVEVCVDGATVGTYHAQQTGSSGSSSTFDLDVMGFVQTQVAPFVSSQASVFGTLNDFYRNLNEDCFKELFVTVYPENINSSGFLETSTASEQSSTTYICPANFYGYDSDLEQFQQAGAGDMYFLTAYRNSRKIRDTDNCYLSYLTRGVDAAQFIFYNGAGSATSFPVLDMVHTSADYGMQTFSVGLANILGQSAGGGLVFQEGAFPTTSNSISYYTVSLGTYDGSYTQESETLQFNVQADCTDKLEVHWFGDHGGAESFVFVGLIEDSVKVGGQLTNITTPWNVTGSPRRNTYSKGIIRTETRRSPEKQVTVAVTPEEAQYISTMFHSAEVYVNDGGNYVSCVIENADIPTTSNRATSIEISFTIVFGDKVTNKI